MLVLFPVFLALATQFNQSLSLAKLGEYLFGKPLIFLFDTLVVTAIFVVLLAIARQAWIAMAGTGLLFYTLSLVEFYKYDVSGSHFTLADLVMTTNMSDVAKFAKLDIHPGVVLSVLFLLAWLLIAFFLDIRVGWERYRSILTVSVSALLLLGIFFPSTISERIMEAFTIDTEPAENVFKVNEKYEKNSLISFLVDSASEQIDRSVETATVPQDYSRQTVASLLSAGFPADSAAGFQAPNVVVVMNESFADMRIFEDLSIAQDTYANFDELRREGYAGTAIVPTFGGYTVKTEFELMFGLPVRSLGNPVIPHRLLSDRPHETFASYYRSLGYSTTYIHPFSRSFYSRDEIYSTYGFDKLYFDDNLTVGAENYRHYIDDRIVYEQIEQELKTSERPAFIFTTTMQNHQPYFDENSPEPEISYYLQNISNSDKQLGAFIDFLREFDEPTVVLFIGDHFPFFTPQSNTYEDLGITGDNCAALYEQSYLIWSNADLLDRSALPQGKTSAFYLPHILADAIGAPKTAVTKSILAEMQRRPVYSPGYGDTETADRMLDLLTYDRVLGEGYSLTQSLKTN
ncbi:LTA synthase family protein [Feifania hominis]|uniref:Sulfatase-like hydrolase/transferase n=1 Tax=Feifania hominis TaxID=2763660 RepID=A0A926DE06_9FIRM|nr:alkaline phosphatase family protein [Feifania hominis]MBC8536873.1 sulfatase-like hydrolase/transferase [Feifania hominis]